MIIALINSLYLLYVHYFPLIPDQPFYALCTAGSYFDCNAVNTSTYSTLLGLPLAAWGVAFYLIFLFLIIYTQYQQHTVIDFTILWVAIFAVLFSVVLGFISFAKIKKFCSFCMILWLCNVVLLILVLLQIKQKYTSIVDGINTIHDFDLIQMIKTTAVQKFTAIVMSIALLSVGIAYGFNAGLQYIYMKNEEHRQTKLIEEFKKDYDTYKKINIKVDDLNPIIGKSECPVHITVFFDFNCSACHRAINMLHELAVKYPETVALYVRHYPLDGTCNRFIKNKNDGSSCHASAIAYTLYGSASFKDYILQLISHRGKVDAEVIRNVVEHLKYNYNELSHLAQKQEVFSHLQKDILLGGKLGIHATPTIIINTTMLNPGIPPAYILEMAIKIEMTKKKK